MQSGQKIEDLFIEERISNLHRGMHRDTIALGLKQVSGQSNARCDPDAAVQRMPAFGAVQRNLQIGPGIGFLQHLPHWFSVEA